MFNIDVEGKPTKLRYTEVQVSPTLFTYQAEASIDGGPWTVIAEGKVTKVKIAALRALLGGAECQMRLAN